MRNPGLVGKSPAERMISMYRVYRLLTDEKGNIVHRTPVVRCGSLQVAESYARTCSNGWPMGIYKVEQDGSEMRVS